MTATPYGPFWATVISGYLSGKTLKAMLVDSSYTFDKDHDFRNDITGEITGTGYSTGGVSLTTVSATYDSALDRIIINADDADFGTLTATGIVGLVVYVSLGSSATDRIIAFHSFAQQDPSGQAFKYQWSDSGVGYLAV